MTSLQVVPGSVVWSGGAPAPVVSAAAAVGRLPGSDGDDPFDRLAVAFLVGYVGNSATAYLTDLKAWGSFCASIGVHPFDARRHHVDAWVRVMQTDPLPRTGRPLAAASIARRLSCVSKFYDYGIGVDVLTFSPVSHVKRPRVPKDSTTTGLAYDEVTRILDAADADSPRAAALICLLTYNGLRIDEALSTNVADYTHNFGHRVLRITRKGGDVATAPLNPITVRALDAYLADAHPPTGPLFLNSAGAARLPYIGAYKLIRRLARAAHIPAADRISPHSLRHTFVTEARAANVPLEDIQEAMGHADPRTTRRYDRSKPTLDRHPTYALATALRRPRADS